MFSENSLRQNAKNTKKTIYVVLYETCKRAMLLCFTRVLFAFLGLEKAFGKAAGARAIALVKTFE